MRLEEWVRERTEAEDSSRADVIGWLSEQTDISSHTLYSVMRGARLKNYDRAKAIETATEGQVTVKELCE